VNTAHFTCQCSDPSHVMQIEFDEEDKEFNFDFYLNPALPLLKRLQVAAEYVLGFGKSFHFDNFLLRKEDWSRLLKVLEPAMEEEPILTEAEATQKITWACNGKNDDEACCALMGLKKAGYDLTKINRKEGFDLKLRKEKSE
jgi:hypothetical protein